MMRNSLTRMMLDKARSELSVTPVFVVSVVNSVLFKLTVTVTEK